MSDPIAASEAEMIAALLAALKEARRLIVNSSLDPTFRVTVQIDAAILKAEGC